MNNLTPELIAKLNAANSAEELLEIAKANGTEMTEEEAKKYFEQISEGRKIADDDLKAVAGGADSSSSSNTVKIKPCQNCGCATGIVMARSLMIGAAEIRCQKCKTLVSTTANINYRP